MTYVQDPHTGKTYFVDNQGRVRSQANSKPQKIVNSAANGLVFFMLLALGVSLIFAWGLNVEPVVTYFDRPLIERIGDFFLLNGFFSHPIVIWIWRVFGCIGWVWVVFTLRRSSLLFWIGAVLAGVAIAVGPAMFKDSSPLIFGISTWFCIQTFELLPTIKGKRATAMDYSARGLAYVSEFYFQFWMHPPYGSGDIRDMASAIASSGQIDWLQVNWEMLVLSLIAIFSFEGVYLIFSSLKDQLWQ